MMRELIVIDRKDTRYPKKLQLLGNKAPRCLYAKGNLSLLSDNAIGFSGSRKASAEALKWSGNCAEQIARKGWVVVSGNAAGVDFEAHLACLRAGGKTIFVLPEGIENFRIKHDFKEFWDWNRILILSQFEPHAIWRVQQAMRRNLTIAAISRALIVVEAGETGGTIAAGETVLFENQMETELYVAEYKNSCTSGNEILISKGATRLSNNNLNLLFNSVENKSYMPRQHQLAGI